MYNMQLVREYTELIERDSEEISFLWKGLQMLCYFSSVVSGYTCSVLFYILWVYIYFLYIHLHTYIHMCAYNRVL